MDKEAGGDSTPPLTIVGVSGSHRKHGNSAALLERALTHLADRHGCAVEHIDLADHDIRPCKACTICGKSRDTGDFMPCVQDDDAHRLWERIAAADGLILATPVYFGLPTPLLVQFLCRSRYLRHQDFRLANKVFGVIAVAGRRTGGNETTIFSAWYPLIRNGMIPVGNGTKSGQFGVVGWAGAAGEIKKDYWALEQTVELAERVHDVARVIQAGQQTLSWHNPLVYDYDAATLSEWEQRQKTRI